MPIVTLLTDAGGSDHYAAAVHARLLAGNPTLQVVHLTHAIQPTDIGHAAFVLRSVFREFPKGTIHIVGVHSTGNRGDQFIAVQLEDHYFLAADNGLLGLISEEPHQQAVVLEPGAEITTFPERDIFAPAAARLAGGASITDLGKPTSGYKRMIDRQVKATKKQITGNVVRVDSTGNLITNIPRQTFELLSKGKAYTIQFGGEKFRRIHTQYHQAEEGECFLLFNSLDLLEIGIYKGNASQLLGLSYDSVVNIVFDE